MARLTPITTSEFAEIRRLPSGNETLVLEVLELSPARNASVQHGDHFVTFITHPYGGLIFPAGSFLRAAFFMNLVTGKDPRNRNAVEISFSDINESLESNVRVVAMVFGQHFPNGRPGRENNVRGVGVRGR